MIRKQLVTTLNNVELISLSKHRNEALLLQVFP